MRLNWRTGKDLSLLTLGACLYTLASPPYDQSWAGWVALAPLFLVARKATPGRAFAAGLLFGVLFCFGIAYWVSFAVSAYFPLPFPLDLLCTIASYSVFIGAYTGLATTLASLLMRCHRPLLRWIGVPASWVIGEFARSTFFSGFSWELLGYTQYRHLALIQIADLTGVYGVSFLLAFSGYTIAELWSYAFSQHGQRATGNGQRADFGLRTLDLGPQRSALSPQPSPWPAVASLVTLAAATLMYGVFRLTEPPRQPETSPITLALVKGNVPSAQRWQRLHYASTLLAYGKVSRQGMTRTQADLIVWPEFALGFYLDKEPPLRVVLNQLTQQLNAPLLLGAPRGEETSNGRRFYNSAYLLAPGGAILDVYDKVRLLPFAEAWPSFLPTLLEQRPEAPTDFTAGDRFTIFSLPKGKFGVLICYEATYPALARRLVHEGAHFLVNISNDTWLTGEAASAQHFSMVVFRAVENRRGIARVATAGVSGFIDPFGRPSQRSTLPEGSVLGEVLPQHELTIYTRYGDWFVYSCIGFTLFAMLFTRLQSSADQGILLPSSWETNGLS